MAEWVPSFQQQDSNGRELEILGIRNLLLVFMAATFFAVTWRRVRRRAR